MRGLIGSVTLDAMNRRRIAALKAVMARTELTERQSLRLLADLDQLIRQYQDVADRLRAVEHVLEVDTTGGVFRRVEP